MEELDSPETREWVAEERSLTAKVLSGIPERAALRRRLTQLWNFPHYGLPIKRGARIFFRKNDGLQNQAIYYVQDREGDASDEAHATGDEALGSGNERLAIDAKNMASGSPPRVLFDPNALSADGNIALTETSVSDDGSLLGYGLASAGSDWNEFHVRDVISGKDREEVLRWVKFSGMAWTKDNHGFFYERYPEVPKGDKLFGKLSGRSMHYHRLGTPQAADPLVFELPAHPEWIFSGETTDDGRYLVISIEHNGRIENAIDVVDLQDPANPRIDAPRTELLGAFDARYSLIGNEGATFYFFTTRDAPTGRIVAIRLGDPSPKDWRTVVPASSDSIEDVVLAGHRLVVLTMHDVASRLAVWSLQGEALGEIALPGPGAVSGLSGQPDSPELFYGYSSFLVAPSIFRRDLGSGTDTVYQQARNAFDPARYVTEEMFYRSKDGTRIPIFLTHRRGLERDGRAPAWLYGYGGFDISLTPQFSVPALVWLELGGVYAQANLRGGGEYGEAWHLAGTKERKQNVFDDFIAAADWLVAQRLTSRDRLVIDGRSNGGLLIGAVINQRPDLAAVALPAVGVMDMLRFHTFTVGAAWVSDYGSSDDPAGFKYLRAYSPLHNIQVEAKYPPTLIVTGDHDDRVYPAHSFKYAAAMQAAVAGRSDSGPVVIRIDTNTGHGGSSGSSPVSKTIDEWADRMGFAVHYLAAGAVRVPEEWAR